MTLHGALQVYHSSLHVKGGGRRCGAPLCYETALRPDEKDIDAVGLDRPEQFEPQADYHYAERQNWATVRDGLAKYRTGDETLADKM